MAKEAIKKSSRQRIHSVKILYSIKIDLISILFKELLEKVIKHEWKKCTKDLTRHFTGLKSKWSTNIWKHAQNYW